MGAFGFARYTRRLRGTAYGRQCSHDCRPCDGSISAAHSFKASSANVLSDLSKGVRTELMESSAASQEMLAGLRVLDLSTMIAAPLAGMLLGDWGADVVKVEQPETGDHVRRFGAQRLGQGLYWKTLGRGKRSVALDLHLREARVRRRRRVVR
jgi:hypothetical protein